MPVKYVFCHGQTPVGDGQVTTVPLSPLTPTVGFFCPDNTTLSTVVAAAIIRQQEHPLAENTYSYLEPAERVRTAKNRGPDEASEESDDEDSSESEPEIPHVPNLLLAGFPAAYRRAVRKLIGDATRDLVYFVPDNEVPDLTRDGKVAAWMANASTETITLGELMVKPELLGCSLYVLACREHEGADQSLTTMESRLPSEIQARTALEQTAHARIVTLADSITQAWFNRSPEEAMALYRAATQEDRISLKLATDVEFLVEAYKITHIELGPLPREWKVYAARLGALVASITGRPESAQIEETYAAAVREGWQRLAQCVLDEDNRNTWESYRQADEVSAAWVESKLRQYGYLVDEPVSPQDVNLEFGLVGEWPQFDPGSPPTGADVGGWNLDELAPEEASQGPESLLLAGAAELEALEINDESESWFAALSILARIQPAPASSYDGEWQTYYAGVHEGAVSRLVDHFRGATGRTSRFAALASAMGASDERAGLFQWLHSQLMADPAIATAWNEYTAGASRKRRADGYDAEENPAKYARLDSEIQTETTTLTADGGDGSTEPVANGGSTTCRCGVPVDWHETQAFEERCFSCGDNIGGSATAVAWFCVPENQQYVAHLACISG